MPDFPSHSSSAGDMRQQLQALLDSKEKQLQQAGALGQRVLAQQVELEERVRQLQDLDMEKDDVGEIDASMRERYRELAETVRTWDAENVQLSSAFGSKRSLNSSPTFPSLELSREEPERPRPAAGTANAQSSRRAKNAAHRADDVEFAFEIGSGLLTEVRRLQSLLGERDKAIQDMKEEKDDLERTVETLRGALKTQEQSTDKYKEENWNLEVALQELRVQFSDTQATVQRVESELKRTTRLLNQSREASDQHKTESERLKNALDEFKAKHDTDVAQHRKHAASLQRDKSDLQQSLDNMKAEVARQGRRLPRFGSPATPDARPGADLLTPHDRDDDDVFSTVASTNRKRGDLSAMFSGDGEYDSSPEASPSRPYVAPNHPSNEVEALQQRLAHAQRQINTLKGTLQREKELKIEYRKRLDGSPGGLGAEEDVSDEEMENAVPSATKSVRKSTPYRVGRGARARGGRGRGGRTLQDRLERAARRHGQDDEDDDVDPTSPPPPMPSLPAFHHGGAEADDDDDFMGPDMDISMDDDAHAHPEPRSPPSNRASIDGMDPAFANILRRSSSSGSLPYQRSPLRNAVTARTLPRRSRGGAAYQEARPPSLIGQPEALAAELFGQDMSPLVEAPRHVETAEFGCQTETMDEEPQVVPEPEAVIQITPASPDTSECGIQVDPEPVPEPPKVELSESSMQTEPEQVVEPEPVPVIVHAEMAIQYESPEPPRVYAEVATETDLEPEPEPEPEPTPIAIPVLLPEVTTAGVQTSPTMTNDADTQTIAEPVAIKHLADADVQTTERERPVSLEEFAFPGGRAEGARRDTVTQATFARDVSGDSTIRGAITALQEQDMESEYDDGATETGADTDTDAEYHDARQSIALTTPTFSFHSANDAYDDEGDETQSIKASQIPDKRSSSVMDRTEPVLPAVTYESQSVQAVFEEPQVAPEPLPVLEPKPELKEMSIQTDAWVPTPPTSPIHAVAPVLQPAVTPAQFKMSGLGIHQFQYVSPPPSSGPTTTTMPIPSAPTSPITLRDSTATVIPRPRTSQSDRRQSIESTLSNVVDDNTPRSRVPSAIPDKSRPPMMMLPPPPRAPPPSNMAPPAFIPDRRIPASSSSSYDVPPGRPISPPPPELIHRATTPTFGSLRSNYSFRQHGSSMPPPQQAIGQRPSTNSFRSAANAAMYAQGNTMPHGVSNFTHTHRGHGLSQTSLHSDHSLGSGRSSLSSDHYFNTRPQTATTGLPPPPDPAADTSASGVGSTDPSVIHAITQTMIGEFLYKYTRRPIGKGYGDKRHKRFFWVHPYTKTLYWSDTDPGSSNVTESSAKSAYIEAVRSVLDPNPLPPGLHQYSVVVSTPHREMKITAPTKERHDIWLNALKYLLARPNPMSVASPASGPVNSTPVSPETGSAELAEEEHRHARLMSSPQSYRSGRSARTNGEWNITPRGQRSRSQISVGGSIGKRSGTPAAEYLRYAGPEGPYSPTKSFEHVLGADDDDLDFELHDESLSDNGFEGLENVRACCDGRHTVGGHPHHHHHHHNHAPPAPAQNGPPPQERARDHLDARSLDPPRSSSPAFSFRSRAGSGTSEGGLFSGKLRFGSRRSTKTPVNG